MSLRSIVLASAFLGLLTGAAAQTLPGKVISHQKISATEGGFTGVLGVATTFTSA